MFQLVKYDFTEEEDEKQIQQLWKNEIKHYSEIYSTQYFQFFHSIFVYIVLGVLLQQQKFKFFFVIVFSSILYILLIKYYISYSFNNLLSSEIDMKNIQEFYLSSKKNNFFLIKENEEILGFVGLEAKSKEKIEIKRLIIKKCEKEKKFQLTEKLFEKAKQFSKEIKMTKIILNCSNYEENLIHFCSSKKFELKNTEKIKHLTCYNFEHLL